MSPIRFTEIEAEAACIASEPNPHAEGTEDHVRFDLAKVDRLLDLYAEVVRSSLATTCLITGEPTPLYEDEEEDEWDDDGDEEDDEWDEDLHQFRREWDLEECCALEVYEAAEEHGYVIESDADLVAFCARHNIDLVREGVV